jgi:hypothetical protein
MKENSANRPSQKEKQDNQIATGDVVSELPEGDLNKVTGGMLLHGDFSATPTNVVSKRIVSP